jgi:hypothetical protein
MSCEYVLELFQVCYVPSFPSFCGFDVREAAIVPSAHDPPCGYRQRGPLVFWKSQVLTWHFEAFASR